LCFFLAGLPMRLLFVLMWVRLFSHQCYFFHLRLLLATATVFTMAGEWALSQAVVKLQIIFLGQLTRRRRNEPVCSCVLEVDLTIRGEQGNCRAMRNCLKVVGSRECLAACFHQDGGAVCSLELDVKQWSCFLRDLFTCSCTVW